MIRLEFPKAVQNSLFYDYFCYLLKFRLGAAIKAAEENPHSIIYWIINYCVCTAALGFARV